MASRLNVGSIAAWITIASVLVGGIYWLTQTPYVKLRPTSTTVLSGEDIEIQWEAKNVDFVTFRFDDGEPQVFSKMSGSVHRKILGDTTVRAEGVRRWGKVLSTVVDILGVPLTANDEVKIAVLRPPHVKIWTEPATVVAGEQFQLRWDAPGADYVLISGIEPGAVRVSFSGARWLHLDDLATYEIAAINRAGQQSDRIIVSPYHPLPTVKLTASPSSVEMGGTSVLWWSAQRTNSVELEEFGSVPLVGSREIKPSMSRTYHITARNAGGQADDSTTISVYKPPESKDLPSRKPQVVVVAGDDSNSNWPAEITLEELERALMQSDRFATILHSELPQALKEQLAQSSVNDLAQICRTAATLDIQYVVVGRCLSVREERVGVQLENFAPSQLDAVVRIQMVDSRTRGVLHSKGFNGREGPMLRLDAKSAYRKLMSRFAIEFVSQLGR